MDKQSIDSDIRKLLEESVDYYDAQANEAKDRIWGEIQKSGQKNQPALLVRILAIACTLLILISTGLSVLYFRSNRIVLAMKEHNAQMNNYNIKLLEKQLSDEQKRTDTIVITQKEYIDKPVFITEKVVDTIYMKETVYVPVEVPADSGTVLKPETFAYEASMDDTLSYTSEVIIRNMNNRRPAKNRKMKFRLFDFEDEAKNVPVRLSLDL